MQTLENKQKKLSRVCLLNPQGYVQYPAPLGLTDTGGQTLYVLQLAQALGKKNIKVDIVTRKFGDFPEEEEISKNVKIIRIPAGSNNFVPKEKLYELMPEMMENFMHYIEKTRKQYDLIHSHYWDGGYGGVLLSKMLDIPHINTPHTLGKAKKMEFSAEDAPPQKLKPMYRYHLRIAIEQKIMNQADAILVLCETTRIQVLQYYTIDFEKLYVVYPGINTDVFNPTKTKYDSQVKLKDNAILMVCRMVPAKGLDRIIEALALIKNKVDFHLYVGGGGVEEYQSEEEKETAELIQSLIKKFRLQKRVTLIGNVPHDTILPAYYRQSDLFILGGRYEPFGLTTLEAMACGAAPLVTSIAGSREVIVDGLNGYIVDTGDRKQTSECIQKLLEDPKQLKKIGENAAFTMNEHYSWDKVVENIIALYKQLL